MTTYDMARVTAKELLMARQRDEEIIIYCVECGEITYPNAYDTSDQDETVRICNGCGKVWEI